MFAIGGAILGYNIAKSIFSNYSIEKSFISLGVGLVIGLVIDILIFILIKKKRNKIEKKRFRKKQIAENSEFIKKQIVSKVISQNVVNYINNGKVLKSYYQYSYSPICSNKINADIEFFLKYHKKRILEKIDKMEGYTDYYTTMGLYRCFDLGFVFSKHYWNRQEESVEPGRIFINIDDKDATNSYQIIRSYGFTLKVRYDSIADNGQPYGDQTYYHDIMAYVKLNDIDYSKNQ